MSPQAQSVTQVAQVSPLLQVPSPQPRQVPATLQVKGELQLPQVPPQPFGPHCLPWQLGVQHAFW